MRIILYLVSLFGFIMITVKLALFALSLAAYMAIMVIGIAAIVGFYIFKAGVFASVFVTEAVCSMTDATNYKEVAKEQIKIRYNERNPQILQRQQANIQMNMQSAERNLVNLQMMYPLADITLFQQYNNCIYHQDFNNLQDIEVRIKRSHREKLI